MNSTQSAGSAVESRLGLSLAAALTVQVQAVTPDIAERLRVAREQAVLGARHARLSRTQRASHTTVVGMARSGVAWLGAHSPWAQRVAALFPLLMLVIGLFMIDQWQTREQLTAAAEIDVQLLADNLPPAAFSDPGFGAFMRGSALK
jgi:hypothetical protein